MRKRTAILLGLFAMGGCLGGGRPGKPPASAIWVGSGKAVPSADALAELSRAGVTDLFVPGARLTWDSGATPTPRLSALPLDGVPAGLHPTLVVSGDWSETADPKATATALTAAVSHLRLEAEGRGRVPTGVHFDLMVPGDLEAGLQSYADTLGHLRGELPRDLYLSASLHWTWLGTEAVAELADNVDFLVAFLYGQRPEEVEDAKAWQIERVARDLKRVDELGVPYQLGVVIQGSAAHLRGSSTLGVATDIGLKQLLAVPALRLEHGFSLESGDRQVYTLRAIGPARLGVWQLQKDDTVRVVRTGAVFLQALLARIKRLELDHRLGEAYVRAAGPGEVLTPALSSLHAALRSEPVAPELVLKLESVTGERPPWRPPLRVTLENRNDEGSELSGLEHNYVEVVAEGGIIGSVDAGGFSRYELRRAGEERNTLRAIRTPDRVRLYLPLLEGRDHVASGAIDVKGAKQVTATATFLLPDGNTVTVPLVVWPPPAQIAAPAASHAAAPPTPRKQ